MDIPSRANTYFARLNIPVRRVEDFLDKKDVKLFDLLVVALIERGAQAGRSRLGLGARLGRSVVAGPQRESYRRGLGLRGRRERGSAVEPFP